MNNDPVSQLPEPYRVAWEILHEPIGYYQMLEHILLAAQKMAGATWGMMILASEINSYHFSFPEFRTPPDMHNSTIPAGYITSMAYVLSRKAIDDGQGIVIPDMDSIIPSYEGHLMNNYLPPSTREMIANRAREKWISSRMLEIPSTSRLTSMAIPIIEKDETIGSVYLHRQVSDGSFNDEDLQKAQTFLTCVAIGIKNAKEASDMKHSGFQILATASSELRTPLITMKGYAQIIRDGLFKAEEKLNQEEATKKFASIIVNNAERVEVVLNDLLDYARIEQGYIYKQGVNLKEIFNPILEKLQSAVNDRHQALTLDIPDSLDVDIEADHYLAPLIEICIQGVHRYTPDGGKISISISLSQDTFKFQVIDSGTSLTKDEKSHFFERYYRTNWQDAARGSGLNLYLAKRVVELWDGQIGVESSPNQGNTLWFTLHVKKEKGETNSK